MRTGRRPFPALFVESGFRKSAPKGEQVKSNLARRSARLATRQSAVDDIGPASADAGLESAKRNPLVLAQTPSGRRGHFSYLGAVPVHVPLVVGHHELETKYLSLLPARQHVAA